MRTDAAARMGKSRAVNKIVNTTLGDYFSSRYTPEQLVSALHEASKHPHLRMLFKSAGLTDVEDLEALRFHHQQINSILKTTNESKKKSSGSDDIRSYEQSVYSALAESPPSSNITVPVPSLASRVKLFPDIPKNTVVRAIIRGKVHRQKMRENKGTTFSRVLERLGKKS
jgi:hypothetical protein